MVPRRPPLLHRRFFCTKICQNHRQHKWDVKQVTKSNYPDSLDQIKNHISDSDFVAVSLKSTGSYSAPWQRPSPFDTPDTAYLKAKYSAERFQILQFAMCPFSIRASKVVAYPYNFHLFPRDELKIGMPSYNFLCQTSYLEYMAREGFDFNTCIYDGISYLSRAQESVAKVRIGNPIPSNNLMKSSSTPSVADAVFIERIRSRVKHWKNACKNSSTGSDEALVRSLRKLVLGSEEYASRPCMTIDVCSERQVQLALEMLREFSNDLVPLIVPATGGGTQAVRVVLTSSKEDKDNFEKELQNIEEEQNRKIRGFREVIDLISASQKPVVSYNSLNDFTFIHAKFLAPLPPIIDEFMSSLRLVFPHVLDVSHMMKEISPLGKMTNMPSAISYLKNRFFAPIDMEIPLQAAENEGKMHGHNVVRTCHLFAKLCSILKIAPNTIQSDNQNLTSVLEYHANTFNEFNPCSTSLQDPIDEDVRIWTGNPKKVSCEDVVFLWGFRGGMTSRMLKSLLQGSHGVFSAEFDIRLVDKSCAILVFSQPGLSETFLNVMNSEEQPCGSLREMVSEGLQATGYGTYKRVCRFGFWEAELADSLDKALAYPDCHSEIDSETKPSEMYWCSDSMINFDEL